MADAPVRGGQLTGGRLRGVALVVALVVLVAGCATGGQLRRYVESNYDVLARSGDNLEARTDLPAGDVAEDLAARFDARDRLDDPTGTFFRNGDDFVAVRPDPAGGTLVSVDSDEVGSSRWVPFIGGVFLGGGRFGGPRRGSSGGFGESTRGGGPGTGK